MKLTAIIHLDECYLKIDDLSEEKKREISRKLSIKLMERVGYQVILKDRTK